MKLFDKVAIITGAGSGSGQAGAVTFAREGAKVIVADVDRNGGEKTVELVRHNGGEASFVQVDCGNVEEGQQVDIAMYDCMAALNEGAVAIHSYTGQIPGRDQPRIQAPLNAFKTKDGYVALMVPTEDMWVRFCKAIDREDLIIHPLLSSGPLRGINHENLLKPVLDEWMITHTVDEVTQIMLAHGVPVGPSQTAADLVRCPQLASRHMILDIEDPIGGNKKIVGSPVKISGVPEIDAIPPPLLGEHNRSILMELLGQNANQIDSLEKDQII
jgi:CoA:oxalate CoA-transferase